LPDGRQFIYYVQGTAEAAGIYLTSLDGGEPKFLTAADSATFIAPDVVLFARQSTLLAQHLDVKRRELTGEPQKVAAPVGSDGVASGHGGFSVSADGRIAYRAIAAAMRQLTWYDRSGKAIDEVVGEPKPGLNNPELSRDGRRVAFGLPNGQAFPDVWLMDLVHGGLTRFTFDPEIDAVPVWSSDGTQIVFYSNRKGIANLYLKASGQTSAEQLLLETPAGKAPQDWSPDGRFLLFSSEQPKSGHDLLVLPMSGNERAPILVANTPFDENNGQFSPDGRWVAYETNESGNRFEIVVQPFPQPAGKWQVSRNGGTQPRWSHDGKEIYFIAPDGKLMAAPVTAGETFSAGPPAPLFQAGLAPIARSGRHQYAVSQDGRFLMNQPVEAGAATPITLILNWHPNQTK
jgi:dipeptidyl aminopeptidase/acylaminoacyl peptidase